MTVSSVPMLPVNIGTLMNKKTVHINFNLMETVFSIFNSHHYTEYCEGEFYIANFVWRCQVPGSS